MDKKQLSVILFIGIIATLFMVGIVIFSTVQSTGYVRVQATIIDISSDRQSGHSASHWVTYEYNANGRNYRGTRRVFSKLGKNIGDIKYIKYDPSNPEKLENTLLRGTGIVLTIFFAAFSMGLIFLARKGKL
ncbi:MAG: DUF3592 domain-containing protein [Clostridium sp.]|nr:DUF3592 domain-containing protein [Clostridium sp.]